MDSVQIDSPSLPSAVRTVSAPRHTAAGATFAGTGLLVVFLGAMVFNQILYFFLIDEATKCTERNPFKRTEVKNEEFSMLRLLLFALIFLAPNFGHAAAADQRSGPKAYLPENVYEFPPILEGLEVVHDFVIHNKGDEPLNIQNVKSG